jgi:hypothetical protein
MPRSRPAASATSGGGTSRSSTSPVPNPSGANGPAPITRASASGPASGRPAPDAARWDAAGLAYTSVVHSDAAPDAKQRRAFIEEGLAAGWKSGQYRAEANRRWPRRLGKGGRGGFDEGGHRPRKPPPNPGLPASLADLARLSEQWVEACRQVWGPNLSALSGEEQVEGLARQLDAAHEALQGLAVELTGLWKAVREARRRLGGKARKK